MPGWSRRSDHPHRWCPGKGEHPGGTWPKPGQSTYATGSGRCGALNLSKCVISQPAVEYWGQRGGDSASTRTHISCGRHASPHGYNRNLSLPRNGQPAWQILQGACRGVSTTQGTTQEGPFLGMGNCPRGGVPEDEDFALLNKSRPRLSWYKERETVVFADASAHRLGATVLQCQHDGKLRPVTYASRALTPTEERYAQIEKEALAETRACEILDYLIGLDTFIIQSDHKLLIPLLGGAKPLVDMPPRIQRFRMRLMRYNYQIVHVPGKELWTADALSRAPVHTSKPRVADTELLVDTNVYVDSIVSDFPTSQGKLREIQIMQEGDPVCRVLLSYVQNGWPNKHELPSLLKPYWQHQNELTLSEDYFSVVPKFDTIWSASGDAWEITSRTPRYCAHKGESTSVNLVAWT